jgi:hypothetical protein
MDIDLSRSRTVAEIVEIGVMKFQELGVARDESPQADIR